MAVSVTAVVAFADVIISVTAKHDTQPVSACIVQLVVVAALVIIVDQILKAYMYQVSKQLSVLVGLVALPNCSSSWVVSEAFALSHKPWESFLRRYRKWNRIRNHISHSRLFQRTVRFGYAVWISGHTPNNYTIGAIRTTV